MRRSMRNRRRPWIAPLAVLGCALVFGGAARAQLDVNIGGLDEANAEGYVLPLAGGLSSGLGSGTFRTGYVPQEGFHFSIGVEAMSVGFDDADRLYQPSDPPGFVSIAKKKVPTVIGDLNSVTIAGEGGTERPFPGGFDMDYLVLAAPELRVGSFMGTRAIVRWIVVKLGDADLGDMSLFGIGAEHSLSQYMPTLPFHLAAGLMYQSFDIGDVLSSNYIQFRVTGSRAVSSWLEPYAGIGYDSFGLKGEYTYKAEGTEENVKIELDRDNSLHAVLGVNLHLGGFTAHSEYNLAAESGVTVGFGFGQ
jgi:hypothetical protein